MAENMTTQSVREDFNPNEVRKTTKYRRRFDVLRSDASDWLTHWSDVNEFFTPRRGRYLNKTASGTSAGHGRNDGTKKNEKTINSIAMDAADTLAALLQNGLCPRTIPWFLFTISDKTLLEQPGVKKWLTDVRDTILYLLERSNFYNTTYSFLKEFGVFGTGCMMIEEDFESVVRFTPYTIGEYYIAVDCRGNPDTFYRKFSLTARQIIKEYGKDNVTEAVINAFNQESDTEFELVHAIQLNDDFDPTYKDKRGKRWISVIYQEDNPDHDVVLSEGGFRTIPFTSPRWDPTSNDTYGDSPGIKTLGDVKMIQKMEEKKLKALDKEVDPPVNVPTSLRGKGATLVAGGANYVDLAAGQAGVTPVQQLKIDLRNLGVELERVEKRINKSMYTDLIQLLLDDTKRRTAYEISIQNSDRLQRLVPAVSRSQSEFLNIVINRVFDIANEFGAIPEMPEVLIDEDIKIEYLSQLSAVLKITQKVKPIQDFLNTAVPVMEIDPSARLKINGLEIMDVLADAHNLPPSIVRSDQEVSDIQQAQAEVQAQREQAEAAMNTVDAAQKLGNTSTDEGTALNKVIENIG